MKTAVSVLLVVLAFGLCNGQMKDSNYTKGTGIVLLCNGSSYLACLPQFNMMEHVI